MKIPTSKAAVAGAFVVAGALLASVPAAMAQSGDSITARAGEGQSGYSVDLFLPADLTVTKGSTVTWEFPWLEPHSVTYGQPAGDPTQPSTPGQSTVELKSATTYFSSGLIVGGGATTPTFSVKFADTGEYEVYCAIHPLMVSNVKVVASGDVDTQAEADARADTEHAAAQAALVALANDVKDDPVKVTPRADGTKRYEMRIGAEHPAGIAMQVFPDALNVLVGDTVAFVNPGNAPHSATFGPYPGGDPFALPASDNKTPWDGTGFYHSGIIGKNFPGGPAFEITFSKAGTYDMYCSLHGNQGQVAQVVVASAPAPTPTVPAPRPPATGSGFAEGSGSSPLLAAGFALLVAGAAALALRRAAR